MCSHTKIQSGRSRPFMPTPMFLFKCGRDSTGIKYHRCLVVDSCRQEEQWFHKKSEMEANLEKAHAIHVILPRGLKIEEEEQSTSGLSTSTSFFKRLWKAKIDSGFYGSTTKVYEITPILHEEAEEERSEPVQCPTSKAHRTCDELEFVAQFMEHRMEKLKLKIAVALDSYVSLNPMAKY